MSAGNPAAKRQLPFGSVFLLRPYDATPREGSSSLSIQPVGYTPRRFTDTVTVDTNIGSVLGTVIKNVALFTQKGVV